MVFDLQELKVAERQYYLQHVIAPRPICFASTVDRAGQVNLSPFSFFNLFSSNPPVAIFSPARRIRDNSTKHTLQNLKEVPEVVINIVTYDMVQQASLASCEYPKGVNEFEKAGFTAIPSVKVQPPRVAESKAQMECRVMEIKPLGDQGGAGNLVICEILLLHIDDTLLDGEKKLDQRKLQHVARLGADWYCRVDENTLFIVPKPNVELGIGVDALPESVRRSRVLTGNHLGMLANVNEFPVIDPAFKDPRLREIIQYFSVNPEEMERELHQYAKHLLDAGRVRDAWQVLLAGS
ncbi:MAG TPA: flavin reductase family protein [Chitinophagaceae bacterium]|nr:flavin reductase family protein [Chitinophagaceae bacterium]